MLIDWFTVVAQLVNFLILVWLLKRFLYQPVLRAIDAREKRIAEQLADAEQQMQHARQQQANFEQKNRDLEQQRSRIVQEATQAAEAERQRLLTAARGEVEGLRATFQAQTQREQQAQQQAVQQQIRQQVFSLSSDLLRDMADSSLQQRMVSVFIRRLAELNDSERTQLAAQLPVATLHSAFPLETAQQAELTAALQPLCPQPLRLTFQTDTDCLCGLELHLPGYKLAWSAANYLDERIQPYQDAT